MEDKRLIEKPRCQMQSMSHKVIRIINCCCNSAIRHPAHAVNLCPRYMQFLEKSEVICMQTYVRLLLGRDPQWITLGWSYTNHPSRRAPMLCHLIRRRDPQWITLGWLYSRAPGNPPEMTAEHCGAPKKNTRIHSAFASIHARSPSRRHVQKI